jgi:hypothetical protein
VKKVAAPKTTKTFVSRTNENFFIFLQVTTTTTTTTTVHSFRSSEMAELVLCDVTRGLEMVGLAHVKRASIAQHRLDPKKHFALFHP